MVFGDLTFGEACVFGGDVACGPAPDVLPDDRGENWRVEATDLRTGEVKAVLRAVAMDWTEVFSRPASATITVVTEDPSAADIWPQTTGVYISRVKKDGTRFGHFGGYVQSFATTGPTTTSIGLQSLDEFPFHRLLADDDEGLAYSTPGYVSPESPGDGKPQTQIAYDLMNLAIAGFGQIPLVPIAEESTQKRVRSWAAYEFKNLGEALKELVDSIDGVKYRLEHQFFENPQRWRTVIRFFDATELDLGVKIRENSEVFKSSLVLDAREGATRVYGVGTGEGATQMFSIAYDSEAAVPEFQATIAWKDVVVPETLDEYTRGAVAAHRDPVATPMAVLVGLDDVPPETLLTGDIISPEIGYGAVTFRNQKAQVVSQAYKVAAGEPVTRTLGLEPILRPALSVKTQVAAVAPPPSAPGEDTPITPISPPVAVGLVTTVNVKSLNEISGMQFMDGNVWVHNDENNNPQVIAVSLSNGGQAGSYSTAGPNRKDPEAIRRHPNGTVWLGDIGDNDNNRSSVRLYQVGGSAVVSLRYPFGPSNAEALLIHPQTGEFFIADKAGRVVSFGTGPSGSGTQVASGLVGNISDGTFTNNGKFALFTVAGASVVYVYSYPGWQSVGQIGIPSLSKCEAITMDSDCSFLVTTEGKKAPIYRVALPKAYGGCA